MITEQDLQEAIAECQGQRNPNANTCIKLAAFYTILDHIRSKGDEGESESVAPPVISTAHSYGMPYDSGSEFSLAIEGLDMNDVLSVMDELMETIKVLNPRLYNGVLRKLDGL